MRLFLQECDDPCCNARTCRPRDGAQCTKGECCTNTCQFKAYGTRCRSSSGQCDIEEYCSGESSECPTDVYKQDGTSCNNNQAYCFSGECQTYDDQCQYHFGSSEWSDMRICQCFLWVNRESLSLSIDQNTPGHPQCLPTLELSLYYGCFVSAMDTVCVHQVGSRRPPHWYLSDIMDYPTIETCYQTPAAHCNGVRCGPVHLKIWTPCLVFCETF